MPIRKMKEFLDSYAIRYMTIGHSPAYTAMETAETSHVLGKELAKVVMVKLDDDMAMVVVPATHKVDLDALRSISGARTVELANEREFNDLFPDCEHGAMPPFGNLYGMKVFASEALAGDKEIAFNAGSHSELLRMSYSDWERLVKPRLAQLSSPATPGMAPDAGATDWTRPPA